MRNQATRNDVLYRQQLERQRRRERPVVILVAIVAAFTFAHALVGMLTPA